MTRINLLPWRETLRKERQRQFASVMTGAVVLMGVTVFYVHLHIGGMIDYQESRNDYLNKEIAKVDEKIKEIRELESQKKQLLNRMDVIQDLQTQRPLVVHMLDELVRTLPEGLYLSSVKQAGMQLQIGGSAQSNARVSAFMRNLDGSEWFDGPKLNVIQVQDNKKAGRVSEFTLVVNQANPSETDDKADKGK
jgi:type IV pilus assembly protein PilN